MSAETRVRRFPIRVLILVAVVALLVLAFALIDLSPDLDHLDTRVLSGPKQGNYYATTQRLGRSASRQHGSVMAAETAGSVDNLRRLADAADDCAAEFALVQDGVPGPEGSDLELIARLPRSESVFVIGPQADRLTRFAQLAGMRIGVGPARSGTDYVARTVFEDADFARLGLVLENHAYDDQLSLMQRSQLDLGVFVLDEDAALIRDAIRERGMQLASFEHLDVIARKYSFLWRGRIGAGQFDPVAVVPAVDKSVLRVDTMVVSNGCAGYAETIGMLMVLTEVFPGLLEHNKSGGRSEFFATSDTAARFFENNGPGFADLYVPWLVDILPLSSWFYFIMAISVLFNIGTGVHKFRLWRVDANRDKADDIVRAILGHGHTPDEIRDLEPAADLDRDAARREIDRALSLYDMLRMKCQVQANSMLVPMGQEGSYRFQEDQMEEMLTALRAFRRRLGDGDPVATTPDAAAQDAG